MNIQGFDSFEAMLDEMDKREKASNEAATERQKRDLGWGTYAFRFDSNSLTPIWTSIFTEAEAAKGEDEFTMKSLRESHERGYRYGNHYSRLCPEGELGSIHIAAMWPISKRDFSIAQEIGWNPENADTWFHDFVGVVLRQIHDAKHGVYHSKFDADEDEGQIFFPVEKDEKS